MFSKIYFSWILLSMFLASHTFTFQYIGIYSICGEQYSDNEFTNQGFNINYTAEILFLYQRELTVWNYQFEYKSFDVCFNETLFQYVVTKLMLDEEFNALENETFDFELYGTPKSLDASLTTKIIAIFAHLPERSFQYLLQVFSMTSIIISKHSNLVTSSTYMQNSDNFRDMDFTVNDIQNYFETERLNGPPRWEEVILVYNIRKNQEPIKPIFNALLKMAGEMTEVCTRVVTVHSNEKLTEKMLKDTLLSKSTNFSENRLVLYVGEIDTFGMKDFSQNNLTVAFPFFTNSCPTTQLECIPIITLSKYVRYLVNVENTIDSFNEGFRRHELPNTTSLNELMNVRIMSSHFNMIVMKFSIFPMWIEGPPISPPIEQPIEKLSHLYNQLLPENNYVDGIFEDIPASKSWYHTKCYRPVCQPGYEKVFGELPNETTIWDVEIGYHCVPCMINYFKLTYGDAKCQKCERYFISNDQKTQCIDPLIPTFNQLYQMSGIITLIMCSSGLGLCLFAIVLFVKFHETPIVKSSEYTMSLIHLTSILLYFCYTPFLFFSKPLPETCASRTVAIALLYNLNITIIYAKSIKLVKAVTSKVQVVKSEVLKTTLVQVFAVTMNLLVAVLLTIILWSRRFPGVSEKLDFDNLNKRLFCDNGIDNMALVSLMLLFQLFSFIQAFRCRKLPTHLSEAMVIVYVSFLGTVSCCVMFPIYFFQKNEEDGELVQALVLSGNNLLIFLFMYCKKMFVILFRPLKNTKQYYRRKQMEAIKLKARKVC